MEEENENLLVSEPLLINTQALLEIREYIDYRNFFMRTGILPMNASIDRREVIINHLESYDPTELNQNIKEKIINFIKQN